MIPKSIEDLKSVKGVVGITVFLVICALLAFLFPRTETARWYSVVPPLLAVTLAMIYGRVLIALTVGIISGGILSALPSQMGHFSAWISGVLSGPVWAIKSATGLNLFLPLGPQLHTYNPFEVDNLHILSFVFLVLAMISVVIVTGGLQAVVLALAKKAEGRRSTQLITALMGMVVFIDDYANTMVVGSSMRPICDKYKVSREKLSFLVDATSAPVAGVALISTWIGYEVGLFGDQAKSLGIDTDGYSMFLNALPFRFYCFLMIGFVFLHLIFGRDFGPMARAEKRAQEKGHLTAPDSRPLTSKSFQVLAPLEQARMSLWCAVIPFGVLFSWLLGGIWVVGGGMAFLYGNPLSVFSPTSWFSVVTEVNSIPILTQAASMGLIAAILSGIFIGKLKLGQLLHSAKSGMVAGILPAYILVGAWTLKTACDTLGTDRFLVEAVAGSLSPLWFPTVVFILAALTAFATGTSWGTMAILIPTMAPLAFALDGSTYGLITMITLGAILDGAIFGDHCSPISDTTIMSSIASSCDHMHHVKTQLPYALTVGVVAIVCGYIPASLGVSSWIGICAGLFAFCGLFWILRVYEAEGVE